MLAQDNSDIRWFAPNPAHSATYAIFGPPSPRFTSHQWMREYAVFYLPRPWPLWMRTLPADQTPDGWYVSAVVALVMLLVGAGLLAWTWSRARDAEPP